MDENTDDEKTTPCKDCGKETTQKRFATYRTRKGELRRRHVCWDCRGKYQEENAEKQKAYRKEYNRKNKTRKGERDAFMKSIGKEYVDSLKDAPCTDCGHKWPPVAMDFDHVRGEKIRSVSGLVSGGYKIKLIEEEIAKCELVCACCHRIRTAERGENKHVESISMRDPFRWILNEIDSKPSEVFEAANFRGREQSKGKSKTWCNQALIYLYNQGRIEKLSRGKYQSKIQVSD